MKNESQALTSTYKHNFKLKESNKKKGQGPYKKQIPINIQVNCIISLNRNLLKNLDTM